MPSKTDVLTILICLQLPNCERALAGRLFEWVDNDGTRHFSDRAPAGLPYREKTVMPASGGAQPGFETGIRDAEHALLEKVQRENSAIERARQAAAEQFEQRKSDCRQARSNYHQAIHRPGTRNGDYKSLRQKMNKACY
jgi:hypothetical protein